MLEQDTQDVRRLANVPSAAGQTQVALQREHCTSARVPKKTQPCAAHARHMTQRATNMPIMARTMQYAPPHGASSTSHTQHNRAAAGNTIHSDHRGWYSTWEGPAPTALSTMPKKFKNSKPSTTSAHISGSAQVVARQPLQQGAVLHHLARQRVQPPLGRVARLVHVGLRGSGTVWQYSTVRYISTVWQSSSTML